MQNILIDLLIVGLIILVIGLEYAFLTYLNKKSQFRKLIKLNRTEETNFEEFNHCYSIIKKRFNFDYFEIVFWKDNHTIIKINKNYFEVFPHGMDLIYDEDEFMTQNLEDYCNA